MIRPAILALASLLLVSGCLMPPKRHAWEILPQDLPLVRESAGWPVLATNRYVRIPDQKRDEAVGLLRDHTFVTLDSVRASHFAPGSLTDREQPYLVRGASFSPRPTYTIVRFEAASGILLVQQFTYNGEMLMPFRWVAEPNALVVFLPRPPKQVLTDAVLAGDSIFRGVDWETLDRR